ncbi:MAG: hypothetical protein ACRDRK_25820 [Pseudonocardia sp.]
MTELETRTSRRTSTWPWALAAGGLLFLVGGLMHPGGDSTLPEPQATAEFIGAPAWIPSHTLLLVGTIGLLIGLFALARSRAPLSTGARRAAWVAAIGAVLLVVEGVFHLGAFVDEEAVLAGAATPFLTTHQLMSLFVYPLFTFSVAALAVLSGRTLTHPAVGIIGALGAVCFGVAPALVGLAGLEALSLLFPIGGTLMALWFTVVGITGLTRRTPAPA